MPDTEQGDALGLSHAVAQLVQLLRTDNSRCDMRAQRLQVTTIACRVQWPCVTATAQEELNDVLSKENSAARRMVDCDGVADALRKRVQELQVGARLLLMFLNLLCGGRLQGKLEAEMATAAQLPDALDQVSCWTCDG